MKSKINILDRDKTKKKINEKISRIREYPLSKMIPNMLTILALCLGLTSIHFAFMGSYQYSMAMIIIAMGLDGLDGQVARALDATSDIGAELDSLSDFVNFGVAPSLIFYISSLNAWGGFGWIICIFYTVCVCLRLARFNVLMKDDDENDSDGDVERSTVATEGSGEIKFSKRYPKLPSNFFLGVPAPMGAAVSLLPIILSLALGYGGGVYPVFPAISLPLSGVLMISRIPTFSSKGIKIRKSNVLPLMVVTVLLASTFVTYPWFSLVFCILLYVISIPISYNRVKSGRYKDFCEGD